MQKTKLLPGLAVGALTLGIAGLSHPAAAAGNSWSSASLQSFMRQEDDGDDDGDDDDDDDDEDTPSAPSGGSSGGSAPAGGGSLPSTGTDPTSMLMLGAIAMTVGGATYRVVSRRGHSA